MIGTMGECTVKIPTIDDRIVQEALRMALEPLWEADFSRHSYGFRPNRSTYDAIASLWKSLIGTSGHTYQWVIEGDRASYFDEIPHRRFIKAVKKRVADRKIRDLLWKFLRAGVMPQEHYRDTLTGTPQGGIISPLAANIYLHQLDQYMESTSLHFTSIQRVRRRKQGKGNVLYVRYADDFVVLCHGTKAEAHAIKEALRGFLRPLGLTLSEDKTKVTHITDSFDFLGYRVIRSIGTQGKMIPKGLVPAKAIKRFRAKVREMLAPSTTKASTSAKIHALNRLTRGWCAYYRSTSSPSWVFSQRGTELFWNMAHWLGRKYESNLPAIMHRFRKDNTFGTKAITLVMPTAYQAKKLLVKTWHNPYTAPEKVMKEKDRMKRESLFCYDKLWRGHEDRQAGRNGPARRSHSARWTHMQKLWEHIPSKRGTGRPQNTSHTVQKPSGYRPPGKFTGTLHRLPQSKDQD
jgi:RNA-directed DNA polymerase